MVLIILFKLAFIAQRNIGIIPDRNAETALLKNLVRFLNQLTFFEHIINRFEDNRR